MRKAFTRGQSGAEPPLDFEHTSNTARIDGGAKQITEPTPRYRPVGEM